MQLLSSRNSHDDSEKSINTSSVEQFLYLEMISLYGAVRRLYIYRAEYTCAVQCNRGVKWEIEKGTRLRCCKRSCGYNLATEFEITRAINYRWTEIFKLKFCCCYFLTLLTDFCWIFVGIHRAFDVYHKYYFMCLPIYLSM